ncbi:hypothetical protein SAMN05216419_101538 [Nitrosomonas cryotolerans]|nr:hypothetical protein SAMN05216419_101538 [Nitrosomonas cryotolerans]
MTDSNIFKLNKPEKNDLLQELLREGARKMLAFYDYPAENW